MSSNDTKSPPFENEIVKTSDLIFFIGTEWRKSLDRLLYACVLAIALAVFQPRKGATQKFAGFEFEISHPELLNAAMVLVVLYMLCGAVADYLTLRELDSRLAKSIQSTKPSVRRVIFAKLGMVGLLVVAALGISLYNVV